MTAIVNAYAPSTADWWRRASLAFQQISTKLQEIFSLADSGAAGDGVTDDQQPITNALTNNPRVFFGALTYKIGANISVTNKLMYGSFTSITGGSITGMADMTAVPVSGGWWAMGMDAPGTAVGGSANQNTGYFGAEVGGTSTASCQKSALLGKVVTYVSSDTVLRDAVAVGAQAIVSAASGRAWGINSFVQINSGSNGYAVSNEAEVYEQSGIAQPNVNTATSKYAYHAVAANGLVAAGIKFTGKSGGTFQNLIIADAGAIASGGYIINYGTSFSVKENGVVNLNVSALTNAASDSAAATAGVAIGQVYRNGSALMVRVA